MSKKKITILYPYSFDLKHLLKIARLLNLKEPEQIDIYKLKINKDENNQAK